MRERGDCTVLHEPFLNFYYAQRAGRALPLHELDKEDMPDDYPGVRDRLLAAADAGPVFFKDMSYYVVPSIFSDPGFSSRLINVFLIRDPRRSIASYYKLDPSFTLAEVGLEAQWAHSLISMRPAMCRLWSVLKTYRPTRAVRLKGFGTMLAWTTWTTPFNGNPDRSRRVGKESLVGMAMCWLQPASQLRKTIRKICSTQLRKRHLIYGNSFPIMRFTTKCWPTPFRAESKVAEKNGGERLRLGIDFGRSPLTLPSTSL